MQIIYVTEIQVFQDGNSSTPTYAYKVSDYGGDADKAEQGALAKYYQLCSGAAVSKLPRHTVVMYTDEGFFMRAETFTHEIPGPVIQESAT
jgi:hypothetical protein